MSDTKPKVSEDEKLLNDVAESEDTGYLEVYIRFNDDSDKDYCFQIKSSTTFKELLKIFETLPIALRPNLFYNGKPVGFKVSTSAGYLTEDGNLLFDYNAHKVLKPIRNINDKVSDHVWPGQLILPVWDFNYFGFYSFIAAMLTWLYTDLPDAISPTPGICLTNQVSRILSRVAEAFGYAKLAHAMVDDIEPASLMAQGLFFAFHIIKVLVIFAFLNTGAFNPIKLFRFGSQNIKLNITKEELLELGWTGSRKASPEDYKEYYREFKIKEYGGMVPAHQAGLFETMKKLGVYLGKGEGFDTPLDTKATLKDLTDPSDSKDYKLTLSYDYLALIGSNFSDHIKNKDVSGFADAVKQHRRYGLLESNDTIKQIVQKRKESGDSKFDSQK
ncbi:uncharacterized protein CANTADRAFT_13536 [Suhomyces tanzawaensis NRRL Y-17324]|uniref:Uncharacterized protein n=1 Tax=Suhomyces tanzawaensis NRRL Y-17324 TaxID=984487 RepID=A0A1E4SBG7_9ASCO|nr:uncharacterized protein CANTADRAFT_13536 [Suhomyces tanzawaensis NRRL Y-17324]ODV76839.1 hypothetical protein CANTADRAFT_13536 [Suhomyces tanzawaensis NRRL Y-17324]